MIVTTGAEVGEDVLTLDASGAFPTLIVRGAGGRSAALNSRRNPIAEADKHLTRVLRGREPEVIVLIGLGLGYMLDAIDAHGLSSRVIAFEPLSDALPHFLNRRDWSGWLATGRLQIVAGPDYANAREAWAAAALAELPPVVLDPGLSQARPDLVPAARGAVTRAQYGSRLDPRRVEVRQSMLHQNVLTMLEHAAATARGAVVEIGAYVGGGTLAMARGIRDSGRDTPMFTVEPGGDYSTHPHLPSSDIFGDLVANLRRCALDGYVTLLQGPSNAPQIVGRIRSALADRQVQIGLLCIDADGQVQRDFDLYLPWCADGCVIAVDDYSGPSDNLKLDTTKQAVDALVARGEASEIGVFGWGTWFGIYTPGGASRSLQPVA